MCVKCGTVREELHSVHSPHHQRFEMHVVRCGTYLSEEQLTRLPPSELYAMHNTAAWWPSSSAV